jgi:hypothetical protein
VQIVGFIICIPELYLEINYKIFDSFFSCHKNRPKSLWEMKPRNAYTNMSILVMYEYYEFELANAHKNERASIPAFIHGI